MIDQPVLSVDAGYSLWAPCYDNDGNPLLALEGPVMRAWFGQLRGALVIDLGCGTGRHSVDLVAAGARVVACDRNLAMLAHARRKLGAKAARLVRAGLPGPLPFPDGSFTLAVLGMVIEHIEPLAATFREVARILQPDGRCIISALHPDRTREGQTARFIDPVTQLRRPIATFHRETNDVLKLAEDAGLKCRREQSLVVPASLATDYPRASRYVGANLGWIAELVRYDASPAPCRSPTAAH